MSFPRVGGLLLRERKSSLTSKAAFWGGTLHPADPEADSGHAGRITHPFKGPEGLGILAVVEKIVRVSFLTVEPFDSRYL